MYNHTSLRGGLCWPPSIMIIRSPALSVWLREQPVLFCWGKSSSGEIGRIFERFLHFLAKPSTQAIRSAGWLRRYWFSTTLG